ncbi:MAG: PAS domain S-box protein [Leptolyngbyaceae cyanobacterium bins.59]|nr:PAS domain S-box protein [Leptolyngbyaceae cyanobacterium bins.59]
MADDDRAVTETWLVGGGETGAWLRSHLSHPPEQSHNVQTVLGTVETWSQSLKTALSILLNAGLPMFIIWGHDRILFYNDSFLAVLRECNSLVPYGRSVYESWDQNWEQMRSDIERVFTTGQPLQREQALFPVNQNDTTRGLLFNWSYSALWDEHGQIGGVFATGLQCSAPETTQPSGFDVSVVRSPSKPTPQQTLQELIHHIETSPLATICWDQECRVAFWSKRAESMFGWTMEEVIGKTPFDWQFVFEEDLEQVNDALAQLLNGVGTTCCNRNYRKDGSVAFCEWYNSTLIDHQGNLVSMLSFVLDVTYREQAGAALQASENRLRRYERIVSATTDAISLVDRQYRYQVVNQAYLDWNQKSYTDIVGHSVTELLGQEVFETVIQPGLDRCFVGETVQYNEWFEFPGVGQQFLSVTYSPYREVDQSISGVVVSVRNITPLKQAEEAVRQSEQRFQEIAQTISQLFFIRSAITREFIYISPAYERIWGRRCESLYQNPDSWVESIHPDDRAGVTQSLTEQFSGSSVQREYRIIQPSGEVRWISAQITLVRDESGNPLHFIGFAKDISDRKELEQELIKSRDFRELLFNESGDALFLVDSDTLLTTDCNQRAVELFEVGSKAELIHIEGHILQKRQFTSQEMATIQQEINEKGGWSREVEYITRRGREFWGDLSVKQLSFGDQRFNLVRVNDISQRKAAEFALQQGEARYLAILEDQTELITRFKFDGTLLFVNDAFCRYYGVSRGEIIGHCYQPLIYPDDQSAIDCCLSALSPENPVSSVEHRVFVNGTVRWMQWTNRAIYDSQGNLLELQSVGRDIDDRKQAELQVQAALAEKEVLLQEVYHRVKNNLQLVQSMLQMQQRRLNNPEAVQALQDSWNRIMTISLVHEILYQSDNLARINLRDYIPALVQHIATSYHLTAPDVVVKTEVESIVAPMKKAICCGLILNELVTNALKYAFPEKKSGQVTVEVTVDRTRPENVITMTVQDNGIGLPQALDLSNIKTLGLTLVQDFVDQLRGAIAVESSQGCLFRITFKLES